MTKTHTVDTLMALAYVYADRHHRYQSFANHESGYDVLAAKAALRLALIEALSPQLLITTDSRELEQAAQPVREPSPGACKTCGNEYLASRTDVYKDKRPFIYCDCCGAMADSKTWYLTHGIGDKT